MPVVIGNFRIEKRIGAGRLGTSFLAGKQGYADKYVVKQVFSDLATDRPLVAGLSRLVDVLAARDLPQIVVYETCISLDDEFFLISPFIAGTSLAELLLLAARGDIDIHPLAALYILRSIVDALVSLHKTQFTCQEGGIHGSLWPDNIFLSDQGEIIIKDIGTWQAPRHSLGKGSVSLIDCYRYLSPGHLTGEIAACSDIFSVGVIMYELLSAQQLFDGVGLMEIVRQIEAAADRVTSGIRAIFGVVCQRCMLAGTQAGYQSMRELAKDLKRLLPESRFESARKRLFELLVVIQDRPERCRQEIDSTADNTEEEHLPSLVEDRDAREDRADTQISLATPLEKSMPATTKILSFGDSAKPKDSVAFSVFGGKNEALLGSGSSDLQRIIDSVLVRPPTNSINIDLDSLEPIYSEGPCQDLELSSDELEVLPELEGEEHVTKDLTDEAQPDEAQPDEAQPDDAVGQRASWLKTMFRRGTK